MKRKVLFQKILAAFLAVSMTAGVSISNVQLVKADDSDPFAFESVSDVTFPLKEKLNLTVFVNAPTTGGGTYQDNYVTDWIEEKTNIHLDFVYDVDGDDAKTKLNLVMTDPSNLPDIFLSTNWSKAEVQSYGQQGLLVPLGDYLEDAPNWNRLNEVSPTRKDDLTMSDGNIYTYGDDNECFHCMFQNRMWIYMPWVEKYCDGKVPETTDELYDFLYKVKNDDPNENGEADEIPMTGFIGGWSTDPTVWLINSFVQCNNPLSNTNPTVGAGLVVNDGKIEYSVMKDEYREALRFINKLYKEGLLDNQTFTQDGEWQDWAIMEPVAGPDGVRLAARNIQTYFGACIGSVSANCKYPEIAVALFDFLASPEASNVQAYGPEGVGWDWTTDGTSLGGGTPAYESYKYDAEKYDWLGNGFDKEYTHSVYVPDACIWSRDTEQRNLVKVPDPDHDTEYYLQQAAAAYEKYSPDLDSLVPDLVFEGADAQTISEGTLTIGGYVNQATVQFITGELDVDKDWDTYIEKLNNMGVENYLATWQNYYDAYENK